MPPSAVRWAFFSPLRLAAACVAVAATVVSGVLLATPEGDPRPPGAGPVVQPAGPSPTPAAATPSPTPSERVRPDARQAVVRAARSFVNTWAGGGQPGSRMRWLRAVKPLTTPSLYRGLRSTDPSRLPGGRVERVSLTQLGAFSSACTVTLTGGMRLDVHMVTEHGAWVVSDIRPAGA